jgi:hypothetical protein
MDHISSGSKQCKHNPPYGRARMLAGQAARLMEKCHSTVLPDTPLAMQRLKVLLGFNSLLGYSLERLVQVATWWAPWLKQERAVAMAEDVLKTPWRLRWLGPRALGNKLKLTNAARDAYNIKDALPADRTDEELKTMRRDNDRLRKKAARQKAGAVSRENSLTALAPWKALGCSERTWRRRGCGRNSSGAKVGSSTGNNPTGTVLVSFVKEKDGTPRMVRYYPSMLGY